MNIATLLYKIQSRTAENKNLRMFKYFTKIDDNMKLDIILKVEDNPHGVSSKVASNNDQITSVQD